MNSREKELSEKLQDKLYYNLYNPKDGIAQTNVNLPALYDIKTCLLYTSPSPRDRYGSRMPSSA